MLNGERVLTQSKLHNQMEVDPLTVFCPFADASTCTVPNVGNVVPLADLQKEITMLPNVLNTRFIDGLMGEGYAVQREGKYIS